ncbi:hypothetical protein CAI21_06775 [Alkalilimnicola ehrlichii]|uniref:fatty acid desaturase n=1 Tax=Alkalilimnicola ehrlichii TaxID=351052 RepID=UPI000E2FD1A1|nr:fatty acid desaturase [Alkalilimnicola ehrlichii]RFA30309.1 hypothetical protein CAI21_06775 [Alkalilimnicola ehrlichii]
MKWQDAAFLLAVSINALLIVVFSAHFLIVLPLVLLQGLLLSGLLEALHQSLHYNFFRSRLMNTVFGLFAGAVLLINFTKYRYFHLEHHRSTNAANDPEQVFYKEPPGKLLSLLFAPFYQLLFSAAINRSRYVPAHKRRESAISFLAILAFVLAMTALAFVAPVLVILLYVIPFCVFAWFDYFLNQGEHYGRPFTGKNEATTLPIPPTT